MITSNYMTHTFSRYELAIAQDKLLCKVFMDCLLVVKVCVRVCIQLILK